ncbi:hypothetical protein [Flavobacterium sp.]|uniref:hypothetical protein n=1 Tax=Flavobacterium sp. TaxID=239 RepID=UPI0011F8DD9B|nr:hypothetical protein [Flavobacterium sp.]RZJ71115.1 MAG: hypothetical protein EOO49_11735 [Flavobacterium sp.]
MKRIFPALLLAVLAPILLATSCDEDPEFYYPAAKVYIENSQNLHVGDTIWYNYLVSSNMYSSGKHDTIANVNPRDLTLFVLKLQPEQNGHNAAVTNAYVKILELGTNDAQACGNDSSTALYHPFFAFQQRLYRIKVGFKMLEPGDYSFPTDYDNLIQTDPQNQLAADYPLASGIDLSYEHPCYGTIQANLDDYPGRSHAFFHVSP